jgi:hypothetical protein
VIDAQQLATVRCAIEEAQRALIGLQRAIDDLTARTRPDLIDRIGELERVLVSVPRGERAAIIRARLGLSKSSYYRTRAAAGKRGLLPVPNESQSSLVRGTRVGSDESSR